MRLSLIILLVSCISAVKAQFFIGTEPLFNKDSLIKNLQFVEDVLLEGHAGLYNYSAPEEIKDVFEFAKKSIQTDLTEREFTVVLAKAIAKIQCGHTFVRLSSQSLERRKEVVGVFPLRLKFIEKKAFVFHNYTYDNTIRKGFEITEVNGNKLRDVVSNILPLIPADGGNEGWKMYQLGKNFDYYYRLYYGNTNNYTLRMNDGSQSRLYSIDPIHKDTLNAVRISRYRQEINLAPLYYSPLKENIVSYLRVSSFSNSTCIKYKQSFKKYMRSSFKKMYKEGVNYLILDLRDNVGGSTDNVIELARYLKTRSFCPYQNITMKKDSPLSYVDYSKKLAKFTYKNSVKKDNTVYWNNKDYTKSYKVNKRRFGGHLIVLIDGSVFSGGSHLCSLVDGRDKTLFIGEKTGGGAKFSNAGIMTTITLPDTKVRISVPMFKGTYATTSPNKIAVFPNKEIKPTQNGLLLDKDEIMEFTLQLVYKMTSK